MWMDSASFTMDSYSKSSRMNNLIGLGLGLVPAESREYDYAYKFVFMHTRADLPAYYA